MITISGDLRNNLICTSTSFVGDRCLMRFFFDASHVLQFQSMQTEIEMSSNESGEEKGFWRNQIGED